MVYSPPIYSDIENNIIDQTSLDENAGTHILIEPYADMSLTDVVSVFWSCFDDDENVVNTIVDAKGIVLENFTKGIEYFISKNDFKNVTDGICSAYYQVRRDGEIMGISNKSQAVILLEDGSGASDNFDLIITTGATITDYDAIHVYPFNVGVVKGEAGKKVTLFTTGVDTIFEDSGSNILQTNLDENGKSSFRIWSKSTGGVLVTAQETDRPDISVSQTVEFGVYAPGIGDILYINHSTRALADGHTPCSIYLKTANSGNRLDITQVHVVVSGSAIIAGYDTNTAQILLNSDKSVEINVVNNYAENIEVEISLPESSGSINRLTVSFIDF